MAITVSSSTRSALVEAKRNGIPSVGVEADPFAHVVTSVKTDWDSDPDVLSRRSHDIAAMARDILRDDALPFDGDIGDAPLCRLNPEQSALPLSGSISPIPLHTALTLLDCLEQCRDERAYRHQVVACWYGV
ncbi:MAG: hypothetical protein RML84_10945 [Anaerolineae bacterium]|nr:hypothetical protein [Anaerolineae bacterium]